MNKCASSLRARVFLCGVALLVFSYIICASLDAKEEIVLDLYQQKKKVFKKIDNFLSHGRGDWRWSVDDACFSQQEESKQ